MTPRWNRRIAAAATIAAVAAIPAAAADAKPASPISIKTIGSHVIVDKPLKVLVTAEKGTTPRVSFYVDGKWRYTTVHSPYRLYGRNGALDVSRLSNGRHRITVRATFRHGRKATARIALRVRKQIVPKTPATTASGTAGNMQTRAVTALPASPATPDAPAATPAPAVQTAPAAPAPTTTATATPSSNPAAKPVWDGSADIGFSAWDDHQDKTTNSTVGDTLISIVDAPAAYGQAGHKAFKFQVNSLQASGGPRAELASYSNLGEGQEWWFGDVLLIPSGQTWASSNHTLTQFKQGGSGSPPLELDFRPGLGGLGVSDSAGWHMIVPNDQVYDRPLAIDWHVKFSADASKGAYEVYVNGTRVVSATGRATLQAGQTSYFKEGQYGDGNGNVTYWLGAKKGTSQAAVQH